jgi:hypothetical protein
MLRPGQEFKRNQILKRLHKLDGKKREPSPAALERVEDVFDTPAVDCDMEWEDEPTQYHHQVQKYAPKRRKLHDIKADTKARYDTWKEIVQSLVQPLLSYIGASSSSATPQKVDIPPCSLCDRQKISLSFCVCVGIVSHSRSCHLYISNVRISPDYQTIDLPTCGCRPFATILVEHGFFPTAPSQPNLAISIDFLEFYYTLFEQSAYAVGAMETALSKFYNRRGCAVTNYKVSAYEFKLTGNNFTQL